MTDSMLEIHGPGLDCAKIVEEIRQAVAEKKRRGVYADARIARAERANLANLKNEDDFQSFYLDCLKDAVFVDINDFDIQERRTRYSRLLVPLKKVIWKLLKFYTYRLWSQQNQVNGLLLSALENAESRYPEKIRAMEARIRRLEQALHPDGAGETAPSSPAAHDE